MSPDRKDLLQEASLGFSMENLFHGFMSREMGELDVSLPDGRQLTVDVHYLLWESLVPEDFLVPMRYEEPMGFGSRGLDENFVYFIIAWSRDPKRDSLLYCDKATHCFLEELEVKHGWSFGMDGVIPDELAERLRNL